MPVSLSQFLIFGIRNRLPQLSIVKLPLRIFVRTKYNSGSVLVSGIINSQTRQTRQNLPCHPVCGARFEYSLSCNDVVVAILGDFRPHFFRNRLVPRQAKLLMMNAQLNLEFLQRLLLGTEIINISVRDVIGLAIECVFISADDSLRQLVQFLVRCTEHTGIEHVVIVFAAVETDEPILNKLLDVLRSRVNHTNDFLVFAPVLPVDKEQVRKHLTVKEHNRRLVVLDSR